MAFFTFPEFFLNFDDLKRFLLIIVFVFRNQKSEILTFIRAQKRRARIFSLDKITYTHFSTIPQSDQWRW